MLHLRSNAIAYLALFVALGGTSYAAIRLPANSVKSRQIAPNAVRSSELRAGSVRSAELARGAVRAADLRRGVIAPEHLRPGIIAPEHLRPGIIAPEHLRPGIIAPDHLRPGIIGPGHLSFRALRPGDIEARGGAATEPQPIATKTSEPVVSTRLDFSEPANTLVTGAVEVTNPDDGSDATVTVAVAHNDHTEPVTFTETVPDGTTATVPVSFVCNGRPGDPLGPQTFTLVVHAGGSGDVEVVNRSIDAVAFKPIPSPP